MSEWSKLGVFFSPHILSFLHIHTYTGSVPFCYVFSSLSPVSLSPSLPSFFALGCFLLERSEWGASIP